MRKNHTEYLKGEEVTMIVTYIGGIYAIIPLKSNLKVVYDSVEVTRFLGYSITVKEI